MNAHLKISLLLAVLLSLQASAQSAESAQAPDELLLVMTSLDGALFDSYNRCDLDKFATFFTSDVEFYHDQGGVTIGSGKLAESVKANICGKARRELIAGTLAVYPMKGYGAVVTGDHRFYSTAAGASSGPTGKAKFVHLWQYKDGQWKITRVISFDHVALAK